MKNVTKVYVDAKGGNNLLYLPLDKIVNNTKSDAMTQAQKEAAALADHGITAAQSAVETTAPPSRRLLPPLPATNISACSATAAKGRQP